jgi:hypothetical protein
MEEFDIQISMNGVENELNSNFVDMSRVEAVGKSPIKNYYGFEGDEDDKSKVEEKKSWTDTLDSITKTFKDYTGYQTNAQVKANKEKELAEKGTRYKVLGMNPFVAIAVSLVFIIGGSVAITKIKAG